MSIPKWVFDPSFSNDEVRQAHMRYQLRLAAIMHNQNGSLSLLSQAAGYSGNYLQVCLSNKYLPERAKLAITAVVGPEPFSCELPSYI